MNPALLTPPPDKGEELIRRLLAARACEACEVEGGRGLAAATAAPPFHLIPGWDRGWYPRQVALCMRHLDCLNTRGNVVRYWRRWARWGMVIASLQEPLNPYSDVAHWSAPG